MNGEKLILCREYIEIRFRDANDQVLLCCFAVRFCPGDRLVSLSQSDDLVPAKQGLPQLQLPEHVVGLTVRRARNRADARECHILNRRTLNRVVGAAEVDLRQVDTAGLRFRLQGGETPGFGLVNTWIALQRLLVDLQQRRCFGFHRHGQSRDHHA